MQQSDTSTPRSRFASPRPFIRPPTISAAAVQARIADRLDGPAYPPPDRAPEKIRAPERKEWRQQTPDEARAELDHFGKEVDLRALAAKHGWRDAPSKRAFEVGADPKAGSYLMVKGGQEIVVTKPGASKSNGQGWSWWPVGGGKGEGGGCISFLQDRQAEGWGRGSLGRVRKELREFLGEDPRQQQARVQAIQSTLQDVVDGKPKARDYTDMRREWQQLEQKTSQYLLKRGIDEQTQRAFAADIRVGRHYGMEIVNFATRDQNHDIIGFEKKGPKQHVLDERSLSMVAKGSDRGITRMGERDPGKIKVVYTGEATIDLLTQWQRDGRPAGAVLCSMSGGPTDRARRELADLVAKSPTAKVNVVTDNDPEKYRIDWRNKTVARMDPPGDRFAADIEAAIRAKVPAAQVERRRPDEDYKDINDQHRNIRKADAQAAFEQALSRCEAPEASAADRQRAAEARDKEHEREMARTLYNALDAGRTTPEQVASTITQMAAAREDRENMARVAAERRAAEEEARRLAWEEAQRASMTHVTRSGMVL